MTDELEIEGVKYVSSKRASELSGYVQDYIGQLARKELIDAQRVGGLWYISKVSLSDYKSHADTYIPQQPARQQANEVDSLISFEGKDHISAARAAKITGYHPDYVGQLARTGSIISRQVGNRWYIDREGILAHKHEKDSLLGAVQAQSVGIVKSDTSNLGATEGVYNGPGPLLTYTKDNGDLMPLYPRQDHQKPETELPEDEDTEEEEYPLPIPIRVLPTKQILYHTGHVKRVKSADYVPGKTAYYRTFQNLAAAALTIVIVLSFGFATLKNSSVYGTNLTPSGSVIQRSTYSAGAAEALGWIGDFIEDLLVKELVYKREQW